MRRRPLPPSGEPSREPATSLPKRLTEWFDTGTAAARFAKAVVSVLVALGLIAGGGLVIKVIVNGGQNPGGHGTIGGSHGGSQGGSGSGGSGSDNPSRSTVSQLVLTQKDFPSGSFPDGGTTMVEPTSAGSGRDDLLLDPFNANLCSTTNTVDPTGAVDYASLWNGGFGQQEVGSEAAIVANPSSLLNNALNNDQECGWQVSSFTFQNDTGPPDVAIQITYSRSNGNLYYILWTHGQLLLQVAVFDGSATNNPPSVADLAGVLETRYHELT